MSKNISCKIRGVQIGAVFGNLTVIKYLSHHIEPNGHKRQQVMVKCVCGIEFPLVALYLGRKDSTCCKKCANKKLHKYTIGEKYDHLTIVGRIPCNRGRSKVVCKCDCGNVVNIRPELLKINQTNNCGCLPRGHWQGEGELSGTYFYRLQKGARSRKIIWNISKQQLWDLFLKQHGKCALTGVDINLNDIKSKFQIKTASLDRINPEKGYEIDNVQWVHKDINIMKYNHTEDKFIDWCKKVATYIKA